MDRSRVWRVGTDNTLPYHALESRNGGPPEPRGVAGELLAAAARRAGIKLSWHQVSVRSLGEGKVDLWPTNSSGSITPNVRVTRPFMRHSFVLVGRIPEWKRPQGWADAPRISIRAGRVSNLILSHYPRSQMVTFSERADALAALCRDEADVMLVEARPLQALLLNRPLVCSGIDLHVTGSTLPPQELGFGSTPEAAPVANLLRAEIDRMLDSGEVTPLLRDWAYYSSGDMDLIYREAAARHANQISMGLVLALVLLAGALYWLFDHARRSQREAVAANQAKTHFLANISHEIRTPLNGILGLAEVLSRTSLEPKQQKLLEGLSNSGRNLLAIVNDVLDLARVARGQFDLKPELVELQPLFADCAPPFAMAAEAKGLRFSLTGIETLPAWVNVDPVRLRQIFMNLVGNAVKFTDHGTVTVRLSATPDRLAIEVVDSGIGISEEARQHLFEKFYQADSSISRRFGGTGLGLSIVKEITEAMGGSIELDSEAGKGSRFLIQLPLRAAEPPAQTKAAEPVSEPAGKTVLRVLVVEDNLTNQMVVRSFLEMSGHSVVCADDGEKGVEAWKTGEFDLILMDCQMPVLDGFQATSIIRGLERTQHRTPIIALTASAMEGDREKCLAGGMDGFLSKPIRSSELNQTLEVWGSGRLSAMPTN